MLREINLKKIFLFLTSLAIVYVVFIKTHLFVSNSSLIIKNIETSTQSPSLLSMVTGQRNSNVQDAMIMKEYLNSFEMFAKVDSKFMLKKHYASKAQDIYARIYSWETDEDYVKLYKKRLSLVYDETSSILKISFLHTDPKIAREIVSFLIDEAEKRLNRYNQEIANKHLKFMIDETKKHKQNLANSIAKLEEYQNKHNFIDPQNEVSSNIAILDSLNARLVDKRAVLKELQTFQTSQSIDIINLKQEISQIKNFIAEISKKLSGENNSGINKNIFEYSILKENMEFNNELYKQSLLQLQLAKVEANKYSKMMQVLIQPSLSANYTQPNELKEVLTILLVMGIFYGIISMLIAIIKDHQL